MVCRKGSARNYEEYFNNILLSKLFPTYNIEQCNTINKQKNTNPVIFRYSTVLERYISHTSFNEKSITIFSIDIVDAIWIKKCCDVLNKSAYVKHSYKKIYDINISFIYGILCILFL